MKERLNVASPKCKSLAKRERFQPGFEEEKAVSYNLTRVYLRVCMSL